MVFQRSDDGGQTWTAPHAIAPGPFKGKSGQDDPQIVVDPVDGRTLWASFMQNFPKASIDVVKSADFGAGPNYNGPGNIWTAHSVDD